MTLSTRVLSDLSETSPAAWDALFGDDDPFVEHAFLSLLEDTGSVGPGTGWEPRHVVVERDGVVVGAVPLYRKTHSYGEYIFDFAWANASHRARIPYYPKLVAMAPFAPATGRRFGFLPGEDPAVITRALLDGILDVERQERAGSTHLLYLDAAELTRATTDGRFLARGSIQFHFLNEGYASFDALLARFRSAARKQVRRERRIVAESGLRIELRRGSELEPRELDAVCDLYFATCDRKGSMPYLREGFFESLRARLGDRALVALAYDGAAPVAMSLSFEKGSHLYGRHWGARDQYDQLHFELCYYRLLEHVIARRLTRFEAGAQGEHKIRRGFVPTRIHSAHHLAHPGLAEAVSSFLASEGVAVDEQIASYAEETPFRRENDPGGG